MIFRQCLILDRAEHATAHDMLTLRDLHRTTQNELDGILLM